VLKLVLAIIIIGAVLILFKRVFPKAA